MPSTVGDWIRECLCTHLGQGVYGLVWDSGTSVIGLPPFGRVTKARELPCFTMNPDPSEWKAKATTSCRCCRSITLHRTTEFILKLKSPLQRLLPSAAVSQAHGPRHEAVTGSPVDPVAPTTGVKDAAVNQPRRPQLVGSNLGECLLFTGTNWSCRPKEVVGQAPANYPRAVAQTNMQRTANLDPLLRMVDSATSVMRQEWPLPSVSILTVRG